MSRVCRNHCRGATKNSRPETIAVCFLAELKPGRQPEVVKRLARFQKYGVWEHLDQGKDLLAAIQDSDEYGEYWLDRRLGCRALRMNIIRSVSTRRLTEVYTGTQARYQGQVIRTSYFDRQYVHGTATDKIPAEKYSQPEYARKFAQLLGEAAAPSMIVGRSLMAGKKPIFDDGDEVVVEDAKGLPEEIILGDHSGSFGDYLQPLETFANHYARPVNERGKFLANPGEFADVYLNSLRNHFHTFKTITEGDAVRSIIFSNTVAMTRAEVLLIGGNGYWDASITPMSSKLLLRSGPI